MPRFKKPVATKRTVPFQREVTPPSPPAGTPTGVNPMSVLQTLGPETLGNIEGGFGTVAEYAKGLENVGSKSSLKDRRAILEKILVGSPEQSQALNDAFNLDKLQPRNRMFIPAELAGIAEGTNFLKGVLESSANTNLGEMVGLGGAVRTVKGEGSILDAAALPLNWLGTLQAAGVIGKLPKGTIPKVLQAGGMYGAGSINPKTRKTLQKYIGSPVSKGWDFLNTPIADMLP
jgi:hypothetical protein